MRFEVVQADITVIGGGLAGVNAAIAAARLGQTVALVQNRPVLGGNSSSEIRVWVCGATAQGNNRYARETGIMGEMHIENQYQNPDGNPYLWDLTVLEKVRVEPNIALFLNTDVHEVSADGPEDNRTIQSVTGWMMGSERRIRFESQVYLDCTGDGLIGFMAGAKYRIGREARHEYNEEWAPEAADDILLGSTILFYTKDVGHPVKFRAPSFAKDIAKTAIPMNRVIRSGDSGCHYWWIEYGGEMDTVHDNEKIRDELWSVIYGIWDYIKNSGKFDAENLTLEWVGATPGKREYRRFIGDYVLNQNDIVNQTPFKDRVAYGGWSIDLHPPQGMYASESGAKKWFADGIYHIPFRSLYSVNVSNLLFAGRNISATHVAFGSTRVMATCAVIGEAAGTGAALSVQKNATPRQIYQEHMKELQQLLLRQDASVIGVKNEDEYDMARAAKVSSSSTLRRIAVESADEAYPLATDVALLFPVSPALDKIELLLDASEPTALELEVWSTGKAENFVPHCLVVETKVDISAGERMWVPAELPWHPEQAQNAFLIVRGNPAVTLYCSHQPLSGVLAFEKDFKPIEPLNLEDHEPDQPVMQWRMKRFNRKPLCFRVYPETQAYDASHAVDGFKRPYGEPHLWVSEPMAAGCEEWLILEWDTPWAISQVHIVFNDDVNEHFNNLHLVQLPCEAMPELAKSYRIEVYRNGEWKVLTQVVGNYMRKQTHKFAEAVNTDKIRLIIEETNGCPRAEVIEIRVY